MRADNLGIVVMALFIITSVCYLFIVIATYLYDSKTKVRRDYLLTGVVMVIFSFFYGAMTIAYSDVFTQLFWAVGFTSGCLFFSIWLSFTTNLVKFKSKLPVILIRSSVFATILLCILCISTDNVTFVNTNFGNQFSYQNNFLFTILFIYIMLMSAALLYVHIKWFLQSKLKRNRRQVFVLIILSATLTPLALVSEFLIPVYTDYTTIPLGSMIILPPAIFIYTSIKKYKLFGITVSNVSEEIFSSVTRPIYVLDNNNTVVIENSSAVECMGLSLIGSDLSEYILTDDVKPDKHFFDNTFASKIVSLKTNSGLKVNDMDLHIERDNFNDALYGIAIFKDMTAIKEMEDRLRLALREALDASKVKSEFLAKMSHEIRTPMNAIIGMADLVLRDDINAPVRENATTIKQAGTNLLSIIDDLLDFSKIESGKLQINPVTYSLSSMINDVANIIRMRMQNSKVTFNIDFDESLPNHLFGDETRIMQVLINILGNSIKHTSEGHITLTVKGDISDNVLYLKMIAEDTGSGIHKDDMQKLFHEYFQVREESDGVGLGLAITQGIIEAMHGEIKAESEFGSGTTFTVVIPQIVEKDVVIETDEEKTSSVFTAPGALVLVVDDISTNLKVVNGLLDPYKMEVDLCLSGIEAIEMVKNEKYDLVFMDYRMPNMDGVETTKNIRALGDSNPYYSTLPIIALTADAVSGRKEMFLQNGFNDFMSKPIDAELLNSVLEEWLPIDKLVFSDKKRVESDKNVTDPADDYNKKIEIPGLDINRGIQLSGGTIEYFYETLASFYDDALERVGLISDCYDKKDLSQYTIYVHALKSAAANVGANDLSMLALALEKAGNDNDWDYIKEKTSSFLSVLEKTLAYIEAALSSYDAERGYGNNTEREEKIKDELKSLRTALEGFDIENVNNSIDKLLKLASTENEKKVIRDISHHILLFEYDQANELIDKI